MSNWTIPSVKLNNGYSIPVLGLGTGDPKLRSSEYDKVLKEAINVGYRHFDTAWIYGNQNDIGKGLKEIFDEGNLKRDDFFICSKVWNTFHKRESAINNCKMILSELQLDYVDLLLMHFPMGWKEGSEPMPFDENGKCLYSDVDYLETWRALEECVEKGWTKSIGVSNFGIEQIKRIIENSKIKPTVNEIETHPYLVLQDMVDFCKQNDIVVVAYSPLAAPYDRPKAFGTDADLDKEILMENPVITRIGKKHGKTNAQIILRWGIQRGTVVIPKTVTKARMIENFDVTSFQLDSQDMREITNLNCNWRAYPLDPFKDHRYFPW